MIPSKVVDSTLRLGSQGPGTDGRMMATPNLAGIMALHPSGGPLSSSLSSPINTQPRSMPRNEQHDGNVASGFGAVPEKTGSLDGISNEIFCMEPLSSFHEGGVLGGSHPRIRYPRARFILVLTVQIQSVDFNSRVQSFISIRMSSPASNTSRRELKRKGSL